MRSGRWRQNLNSRGICIQGRTLGSVGLGNIAGELFRMARGMGFGRLVAFDPYAAPERDGESGVELVSLEVLMRESDFVAVNAPLNAETRGLIGARERHGAATVADLFRPLLCGEVMEFLGGAIFFPFLF